MLRTLASTTRRVLLPRPPALVPSYLTPRVLTSTLAASSKPFAAALDDDEMSRAVKRPHGVAAPPVQRIPFLPAAVPPLDMRSGVPPPLPPALLEVDDLALDPADVLFTTGTYILRPVRDYCRVCNCELRQSRWGLENQHRSRMYQGSQPTLLAKCRLCYMPLAAGDAPWMCPVLPSGPC